MSYLIQNEREDEKVRQKLKAKKVKEFTGIDLDNETISNQLFSDIITDTINRVTYGIESS